LARSIVFDDSQDIRIEAGEARFDEEVLEGHSDGWLEEKKKEKKRGRSEIIYLSILKFMTQTKRPRCCMSRCKLVDCIP
jgi:hypothetical protein